LFTDPQSVTVNAVAISLPRVSTGADSATYRSADGLTTMSVRHLYGKRYRRSIQLSQTSTVADPLIPANSQVVRQNVTVTFDVPPVGLTTTVQKQLADGLLAYLSASTGAQVTKILGGES